MHAPCSPERESLESPLYNYVLSRTAVWRKTQSVHTQNTDNKIKSKIFTNFSTLYAIKRTGVKLFIQKGKLCLFFARKQITR